MLYTVPTGKAAIVKNVRVVNRDTSPRTINIYYLRNGLANNATNVRYLFPVNMSVAASALAMDENEVTLGGGRPDRWRRKRSERARLRHFRN